MRTRVLTTALFALAAITACHRPQVAATPAPPIRHFAVILEHSATGWTAHCETGCAWVDLSMSCAGCDVRLDASGIARAYPAAPAALGFSVVLSSAGEGGWTARGLQGVRWQSLSWSCNTAVCRGRLDETGVRRA